MASESIMLSWSSPHSNPSNNKNNQKNEVIESKDKNNHVLVQYAYCYEYENFRQTLPNTKENEPS